MGDPKKEPQFEALVRELNDLTGRRFSVERAQYPHPKTGRTMIEFRLVCEGMGCSLFSTKDYNRISEVVQYTIDLVKAGVFK